MTTVSTKRKKYETYFSLIQIWEEKHAEICFQKSRTSFLLLLNSFINEVTNWKVDHQNEGQTNLGYITWWCTHNFKWWTIKKWKMFIMNTFNYQEYNPLLKKQNIMEKCLHPYKISTISMYPDSPHFLKSKISWKKKIGIECSRISLCQINHLWFHLAYSWFTQFNMIKSLGQVAKDKKEQLNSCL